MVRKLTDDFSAIPALAEFEQINASVLACGIGIGSSAYEAEFNATKALMTAKERGRGTWMIFFEDKTVVGPLGAKEQITLWVFIRTSAGYQQANSSQRCDAQSSVLRLA